MLVEHNGPDQHIHQELQIVPAGDNLGQAIKHLPPDVAQYYSDAIKVLRAGVPDAAAVQLRRTLEAAAAHYGAAEKTLVNSIKKLIADGHVTTSFGDVLHHVRVVGNLGAHHTDVRVDTDAAQRVLLFTAALLRDLFELPAELAALKAETPADADDAPGATPAPSP
ncbi:DUF4145 domain-containing protein [Kribbella jiaozuonensis]|nr:DUF4145 domain-containing protein [Kribbella jiaozuonensis]